MGADEIQITDDHREQYREEGYFVLENAVSPEHLRILQECCDHLIAIVDGELERLGTDHVHITHKGVRYHIAKRYREVPRLAEYVFGELMGEICRATIGPNAFLFYDQYVVKCAEKGIRFSWHQDSGYLDIPHRPYVTCWAAVDDMTVENGTAWVLPFSQAGRRDVVEHVRDPETGDRVGYFGAERGVPIVAPAGSVAVFTSVSFHRSGPNLTDRMRRAYVTQYSPEAIVKPDGSGPLHLAEPFLKDGMLVSHG